VACSHREVLGLLTGHVALQGRFAVELELVTLDEDGELVDCGCCLRQHAHHQRAVLVQAQRDLRVVADEVETLDALVTDEVVDAQLDVALFRFVEALDLVLVDVGERVDLHNPRLQNGAVLAHEYLDVAGADVRVAAEAGLLENDVACGVAVHGDPTLAVQADLVDVHVFELELVSDLLLLQTVVHEYKLVEFGLAQFAQVILNFDAVCAALVGLVFDREGDYTRVALAHVD